MIGVNYLSDSAIMKSRVFPKNCISEFILFKELLSFFIIYIFLNRFEANLNILLI
jgi:hypothetical protein